MKQIRIALLLSALTLTAAALADGPATGRSFSYSGTDATAADYSNGGAVFKLRTKVTVAPYLYVSGNLGAAWTVNGWGSGDDAKSESLVLFHNETLTFVMSDFSDLKKTDGTKTGSQAIGLQGQLRLYKGDANGAPLMDTSLVPAAKLNGAWGPVGSGDTGGKATLTFTRKITLDAGVGPGSYENVGTLTFSRN